MTSQRTLSIIKPDAVKRNITGKIIQKFEDGGLSIIAQKRMLLTKEKAEAFYSVHQARPFYNDLVSFMTSGPVVVQVLEGDNAIQRNRDIMGATNPEEADSGTIRAEYALNIEANSVHGSDSEDNAVIEISFFFDPSEINS